MIFFKRNRKECIILLPKRNALRTKRKQKKIQEKAKKKAGKEDVWWLMTIDVPVVEAHTQIHLHTHTPVEKHNLEIFVKRKKLQKTK